jgi:hypothetical protein
MSRSFRFDGFDVDETAGRVFRGSTRVHLREQSFKVLLVLLERRGQVVTREDLRRQLWPAELFWDQGLLGFMRPRVTLPAGIAHALRAVEIDGTLADPHALLAQFLKQLDFNWTEAGHEMALALELNPLTPIVRMRRAVSALMPFGHLDEALADLHLTLELDPRAVMPRTWLCTVLWLDRQHARAVEQARVWRDNLYSRVRPPEPGVADGIRERRAYRVNTMRWSGATHSAWVTPENRSTSFRLPSNQPSIPVSLTFAVAVPR